MALVNSDNTFSSLNIPKHAIGPLLLYVFKKLCNDPLTSKSPSYVLAIRITTSGDNIPCAVWNDGRVSDGERTDDDMNGNAVLDSLFLVDRGDVMVEVELGGIDELLLSEPLRGRR